MKTNKLIKYTTYLLVFVWVFLSEFFDDVSGKYALFNRAFITFPYMIFGITALITLLLSIKRILSKKIHINLMDIIFHLFLATMSIIFLSLNFKTTIAICKDAIEGKDFTTLEISDDSKIVESEYFHSKCYLKGTTSNGEYITFVISDNDFVNIIIINNAKLIKIDYWKNSKTLCSWTDISNLYNTN